MLVSVLCSGSSGNSTLVSSGNTHILIDLGMNNKYICEKLKENNIDASDISCVLVTHTHKDHTGAMKVFLKKNNPTLYISKSMINDIHDLVGDYDNISLEDGKFNISDDISVETFNTSHDAPGARGYIISDKNTSMVYVTDTGYINTRILNKIKDKNIYVFESNHDTEMLMHGRYPSYLKKRILSDEGHLSNEQAGFYLSKLVGNNTKYIILAHLSHENNTEKLAYETVKEALLNENINFNNIITAKQNESVTINI